MRLTTRQVTQIILGVGVLGWIGWDIYVATTPQQGDTISEVLLSWGSRISLIPLALGALMGHLFAPRKYKRYRLDLVAVVVILAGGWDLYVWASETTGLYPLIPLLLGIPVGIIAWPQRPENAALPDAPQTPE